ncbi:hypothetical protein AX16_009108 [Volvariella volvacea WC 439]|nr:hypothetical protein AX16_009108 [Volvariella volvacea WC 439]
MADHLQHTRLFPVLEKNVRFKGDDSKVSAPASKLYSDVLRSIFLMTAESARWELKGYVPQASHVCAYWRSVALDTPGLWNRFSIVTSGSYNWNWVRECQQRAKSMPFEVRLSRNRDAGTLTRPLPPPAQMIHEVFPDFLHIQSFHVTGDWELIHDLFTPYANTPNPRIRHLSILLSDEPRVRFPLFMPFNGDMPNLTTLKLRGYSISNSAHFWQQSLRSLHIYPPALDPYTNIQAQVSLHIFAALPYLENLQIVLPPHGERPIMRSDSSPPTLCTPVKLNSLRKLFINAPDDSPSVAARMLSSIELPSCTHFSLTTSCRTARQGDFLNLFLVLAHLMATSPISHTPMHCLFASPISVVAQAWDDCDSLVNGAGHVCPFLGQSDRVVVSPTFGVKFTGKMPRHLLPELVEETVVPLIRLLNVQHLRSLSWKTSVPSPRPKFTISSSFFAQAVELRDVEARTDDWMFIDRIIPEVGCSAPGESHTTPLVRDKCSV